VRKRVRLQAKFKRCFSLAIVRVEFVANLAIQMAASCLIKRSIYLYRPTLLRRTCAVSRIPSLASLLVALATENLRCHNFPTSSRCNTLYDVLLPRDWIRTRCTMKEHPATPYLPAALQGGRHLTHPREIDWGLDALMRRAALGRIVDR
jgi:hypothetical protein